MGAIRRWLLAGLLVLVPLAVTVWLLNWIIGTLDQTLQILPGDWHPDKLLGFHIPGFGVLLALAIVPAATLGLMAATLEATKGRFPMPAILVSAFRAGQQRALHMMSHDPTPLVVVSSPLTLLFSVQ